MVGNLGSHVIEVSFVPFNDGRFNCKIVFTNLEEVLKDLGYEVQRAETRQSGQGTPLATRVLSGSRSQQFAIPVTIRIAHHQDRHFNRKVVFVDLEETLRRNRITVDVCETRENGRGTPIALRVRI